MKQEDNISFLNILSQECKKMTNTNKCVTVYEYNDTLFF